MCLACGPRQENKSHKNKMISILKEREGMGGRYPGGSSKNSCGCVCRTSKL